MLSQKLKNLEKEEEDPKKIEEKIDASLAARDAYLPTQYTIIIRIIII